MLVLMLFQTVIEDFLFINFCSQISLKSATDCCQTEQQIQHDAWDSARRARIARICQQRLHKNCPQMLEKEQSPPNNSPVWMPLRYHVWGAIHDDSETFIQSPKQFLHWDNLP